MAARRLFFWRAALIPALFSLSACMTSNNSHSQNPIELTRDDDRLGMTSLQLGDELEKAEPQAIKHYGDSPRCEDRRVPIGQSRKAFALRICEHKPENTALYGSVVQRVVTYYLDGTLVRLDVDADGDEAEYLAAVKRLEEQWSSAEVRALKASQRSEALWHSNQDMIGISHLASNARIEYRLRDKRLADVLPWLAE